MSKASKKDRATIIKALEAGRVTVAPHKAEAIGNFFANIGSGKCDSTLTKVEVEECWGKWSRKDKKTGEERGNDGGFEVGWQTVSAGAGGLTFRIKGGKLLCDNECMSREFIKGVLSKLVDEMVLDWENGKRVGE